MKGYKPPYTCLCGETYMNLTALGKCLVKHMQHLVVTPASGYATFKCPCDQFRGYRVVEDPGCYGPSAFAKHMLKKGMHAHFLELNLGESHDSSS